MLIVINTNRIRFFFKINILIIINILVIATLLINAVFNIIKKLKNILLIELYILILEELLKLKIINAIIISKIKKLANFFKKVILNSIYIYAKKVFKAIKFFKIIKAYNI